MVLLAAMVPQAAFAIVEIAGAVSTGTGVNVAIVNVTHTVPAGTDRYLLVGVSKNGGGGGGNVVSVVWDDGTNPPQPLTQLGTVNNTARRASIFGLVAPNVAAAGTVTVTLSAGNMRSVVGAVNLIGVNQTTPGGDFFSATGNSTTPTVNVCPTAAGNCPMQAGDLAVAVLGTRGNSGAVTIDPIAPSTISFDAASESDGANVSTISWSHTIVRPTCASSWSASWSSRTAAGPPTAPVSAMPTLPT